MNKTLQTSFEIQVISAYEEFNWSLLKLRKDRAFDSHQKPHNLQIYSMFNKTYPNVCPTFEYFRFMANCRLKYNDSIETFLNSYICPICKERPKKDICNSGRNGKYKGKTCKRKECHIELRKRTNLSKGGNSCALHRTDVKPKVEASFKRNWGVQYAGQSEEIRNKWQKTNLEKTGYAFQFQNPETQKKVRDTWKNMSIERKQYILQKKSSIDNQEYSKEREYRVKVFSLREKTTGCIKERDRVIKSRIKAFLKKNHIKYTYKNNLFKLFREGETTSTYYIRYVSPENSIMQIPSLGIEGLPKNYYFSIQEELERKGIFCNFIRSYEWLDKNKRQILKSNILHSMGKTSTVFYARDCEVKEFHNSEVKAFQKENCFYGYRCSSSVCLGLVLKKSKNGLKKGSLVELMTFGLNYFGKKRKIEIHRVGSLKNTYTVGGMSKLLKHFFSSYKCKEVIYYLDWCHHSGKALTKDAGFTLLSKAASFHNYELESMEAFGRRPGKHKEIMRKVARGSVINVPIVGTKTFRIKHQVT